MSLLTRCPACTTLYKVVPDQLRISQGWVKCGQCGDIFDATQHLIEASTESQAPIDEALSGSREGASADASLDGQDEARDVDLTEEHPPHVLSEPEPAIAPQEGEGLEIDASAAVDAFDAGAHGDAARKPLDSSALQEVSGAMHEAQTVSQRVEQPLLGSETTGQSEALVAATSLSFMREADQPVVSQRSWSRGVWVSLCMLLVMALAGQWVYQDHDRLAASRPQWRVGLEALCAVLRCSVEPLQQIESIAIDAAAFKQVAPGRYRLSFIVKNNANLILALPNIELTLTDAQDRVAVRRVLSSQDIAATADHLAANAEWPAMVDLRLRTDVSAPAVVGYRLLAFYP